MIHHNYLEDIEDTAADLASRDVVGRIWQKDHTVWKPDPAEITNRLGWLNISDLMSAQVPALQYFAQEIRESGFSHVVLLGMGGSSLGPEVLRQTFGNRTGYPELLVLDSTVPVSVKSVRETIDPAHTLFVVSSKSGTTIEPNLFLKYFKELVEMAVGKGKAGENFVAITDPGTPLAELAQNEGFRRIFLNPPDIGGRYSVLSYFGLVPAALAGIDIKELLDSANIMKKSCGLSVPADHNHGSWLGAYMGNLTRKGRDKLTLISSPSISSFGLWVEQLIAESTGKEGKGIIPVAGELLMNIPRYSNDRCFVCLRLEGDDNATIDKLLERIKSSAHPVLVIEIKDKYDLGAEFYRWEFATAIAGAIIGVNPFDQPNVQQAKDATERILQDYKESNALPQIDAPGSVSDLLAAAGENQYLAILAYLHETPEISGAMVEFRRKIAERFGITTTLGYGPRYLHSTGQLHKGGTPSGLFLQITADHEEDIPIPGMPYTFGVVAEAQALGDFQALKSVGRNVVRLHLSQNYKEDILKLVSEMK